jgi:DNA-binding NarL/FixJ family response regulator
LHIDTKPVGNPGFDLCEYPRATQSAIVGYVQRTDVVGGKCVIDREIRGMQQKSQDQVPGLSDTGYQVLQDIALGLTDRAIASRRSLSLRSVQNRLQQSYETLGVYRPTMR